MQHYLQKISENDLEQIRHIPHGEIGKTYLYISNLSD